MLWIRDSTARGAGRRTSGPGFIEVVEAERRCFSGREGPRPRLLILPRRGRCSYGPEAPASGWPVPARTQSLAPRALRPEPGQAAHDLAAVLRPPEGLA